MRHMLRPPTRLQLAEWQATSFMLNVSIHCSSAASPEGKVQLCSLNQELVLVKASKQYRVTDVVIGGRCQTGVYERLLKDTRPCRRRPASFCIHSSDKCS